MSLKFKSRVHLHSKISIDPRPLQLIQPDNTNHVYSHANCHSQSHARQRESHAIPKISNQNQRKKNQQYGRTKPKISFEDHILHS